ncbi:unnamed protein product [Orchesella dallaii]|uniref:Protein kinase domain-containing protein n=1 Tax=Orchesella dallaii TaxID=48710 RepID=A0ABP1QFL5_9HEXA
MANRVAIQVPLYQKEHLELGKVVGQGAFGKVCVARFKDPSLPLVAIKQFHTEQWKAVTQQDRDKAYAELLKVAVMRHANIVMLVGMVRDALPWLIFEYMPGGNLKDFVSTPNRPLTGDILYGFCRDICNGMEYLHKYQFLHRDLAARNILLNGNIAKIADLGLTSIIRPGTDGRYTVDNFAIHHAAREVIFDKVYQKESDVWSFGVLMFEMFSRGRTPYGSQATKEQIYDYVQRGVTPVQLQPSLFSKSVSEIMAIILKLHRAERPTFQTLATYFTRVVPVSPALPANADPNAVFQKFSNFHRSRAGGQLYAVKN